MSQRKSRYTWIATILGVSGVAIVVTGAVAYWLKLGVGGLSSEPGDWGTFGDFMGGFPGTLIALATLVALALTLHLQAEELARTAAALENQAEAATEQHRLTREIEMRRIRPLLKVEWFERFDQDQHQCVVELRMRNVGLGAAIVDRIEVTSKDETFWITVDDEESRTNWVTALGSALPEFPKSNDLTLRVQPFGDLTRALAPSEYQSILRMSYFPTVGDKSIRSLLEKNTHLAIHFRSLAGQRLSTRDQFDIEPL